MTTSLKEEQITIPGAVSIGATITYTGKDKLSPAIVIIMGTGKTDRDGNEKGFRTDLYKKFAEFFAGLGFVCVRYDKRGTFQSTGNFNTAGLLLFGGAATSMKDALLYQNDLTSKEFQQKKGLLGMLLRSQTSKEKINTKVDAMFQKCINTKKDRVFFGGAMLNAKWVKEHASYSSEDYITLLKKYGKPILAVTGTAEKITEWLRQFQAM